MHTVSIIKYQGSTFEKIFETSGGSESDLLEEAKKKILFESLKRHREFRVNDHPRTRLNSGLKIYNVTDVTPSSNDSLGPGTLSHNILINDPGDLRALEQKRINAGFHAGF